MKTILITILLTSTIWLTGCVTASREPISAQNKIDFKWETLNLDQKIKVFSVAAPVKVLGTGSINLNNDGSFQVDTSTKARVIGDVVQKGLEIGAGVAREVWGGMK